MKERMYNDLAWTWPIISPVEDYIEESEELAALVHKHSKIEARTLLHLGCGGGHNDYTLKKFFRVTGVDCSESMLALARELNPEARYMIGDMRTIRLGEPFDVVLIHDSICYMTTESALRGAFSTACEHLKPGGVFLTFAEKTRETFRQNNTHSSIGKKGDIDIVLVENDYDTDTADTEYEATAIFIIRRAGKLQIETDDHALGLFSLQTWIESLRQTGFDIVDILTGSDKNVECYRTIVSVKPMT